VVHVRKLRTLLAAVMVASLVFSATPGYATVNLLQINSLSFAPDGMHGFMAGANASANPAQGFLSYTVDGGSSWHAYAVPQHQMSRVLAETADTALASGGYDSSAYRTSDGGGAWTPTAGTYFPGRSGTEVGGITLFAGGRVAVAGTFVSAENGKVAAIATSDDHGASWTERFAGPLYTAPEGEPVPSTRAMFVDIDAVAASSVAWAVGWEYPQGSASAVPPSPLIYKTATSGATWTPQSPAGSAPLNAVTAVNESVAYAAGPGRTLFKTTDGSTWVNTLIPRPVVTVNPDFYGIDSTDENHVVLVGADANGNGGVIQWTTNGSTWTNYRVFAGTVLRSVVMRDATHWIAVGDNETIVRTDDGGANWTSTVGVKPPAATITSTLPAQTASSLTLSGIASDAGVGVAKVEVSVMRDDNQFWNGSAWQAAPAWALATSPNGWDTWSYAANLAPTSGQQRTCVITARATDGLGASGLSPSKSVLLGSGTVAPPTAPTVGISSPVSGDVVVSSAPISISGMAFAYGATVGSVSLTITRSDGLWTLGPVPAAVSGTSWAYGWQPPANENRTYTVSATALDSNGLRRTSAPVTLRVDTTAVVVPPVVPPAVVPVASSLTPLSGPSSGAYGARVTLSGSLRSASGAALVGKTVTLQYSSDKVNWVTLSGGASTTSTGGFATTVYPTRRTYYRALFAGDATALSSVSAAKAVLPRVSLSTPSAPASARRLRAFSSVGYLKPYHAAAAVSQVTIQCYRYERQRNGRYTWILRRNVATRASRYSSATTRYTGSVKLPYAGRWAIRAYHRADTLNAATTSAFHYLTVK